MIKKRKHSFAKYNFFRIVSIFFLFALLTNIVYIPCYFYVRNFNERTVLEHQQSKLDDGMQLLESSIDALIGLPNTVSINADYNTTYYDRADFDDINLNRLRMLFNSTLSHFDFVSEIGLLMEDSILFSRDRIYYDKDILSYDAYFSCNRPEYFSEFIGAYCALPSAHFSTNSNITSYDALTVAVRWQKSSHMYFFVHYPLNSLFPLFADDELLDCAYLAVYSQDTLLAEHGVPLTESYHTLTTEIGNQLGISVVLQVPNAYISQSLEGMSHLIRIFISIVLFAAILWIIVFSSLLWRPFRHIQRVLHLTGYVPENPTSLVDSIISLGQQVSYYKEISETQQEYNRIHLFERAIYRGIQNESDLKAFQSAFPEFPETWQFAMLHIASDDSSITPNSLHPILIQYLQAVFPYVFILPQGQDSLLLLLSAKPEDNQMILRDMCSRIQENHLVSATFTCSDVYEDIASLPNAFQEIEYEDFPLSSYSEFCAISIAQLQTIYLALQRGDANLAISTLQKSTAIMLERNDLFSAKHSSHMLKYTLVTLKMECEFISDIAIPTFRSERLWQYYEQDLPDCFVAIADRVKQQNVEQIARLESNILQYIQDHLTDQQLSVTSVAEHFHISATTLQKRMSAICGKTFSAYVESVRMKRAQQLLRESSDTVQEIARAVGYVNVNSFYKAYKRCFGETPLSYRNKT